MTSINIDAANLCIKLVCGIGESNVIFQAAAIYSAWKEWLLINDNSKYLQAMDSSGGEPAGGSNIDSVYFLLVSNGWKICPVTVEPEVRIQIVGNIFPDIAGQQMFGYDFVVAAGHTHIETVVSTSARIVESGVSGLTPSESTKLDVIDEVKNLNQQILALNNQMNKLIKLIPASL